MVTKGWEWPDGAADSEVNAIALNQLRRDRDEWKAVAERRMQERDGLMAALEGVLRRGSVEAHNAAVALLTRIKSQG